MSKQLCRVIDLSLRMCEGIARTPFQDAKVSWQSEAALALLLINLKDVLGALKTLGHRIDFNDDVDGGGDITDLVANMRNAICHNGSPLRMFDPENNNSLSFNVITGKLTLMQIGDFVIGNPYPDDVAFFYGRLRILLVRQIYRAIREARTVFPVVAAKHGYKIYPG